MKNLGKYNDKLDVPKKKDIDEVKQEAVSNKSAIDSHIANKNNPHNVTSNQVSYTPTVGGVIQDTDVQGALKTIEAGFSGLGNSLQAVGNELRTHENNKNNPHAVTAEQIGAVKKTGDTMTGDLNVGSVKLDATNGYVIGSWLQGKSTGHLTTPATKIAIVDASGWIYYRTPEELKADMNIQAGGVDIKVQSAQPTGQKVGDFWYQIV